MRLVAENFNQLSFKLNYSSIDFLWPTCPHNEYQIWYFLQMFNLSELQQYGTIFLEFLKFIHASLHQPLTVS